MATSLKEVVTIVWGQDFENFSEFVGHSETAFNTQRQARVSEFVYGELSLAMLYGYTLSIRCADRLSAQCLQALQEVIENEALFVADTQEWIIADPHFLVEFKDRVMPLPRSSNEYGASTQIGLL